MLRRSRHTETPHTAGSRGAALIKANYRRGTGKKSSPFTSSRTLQRNDKPNTRQGTRGGRPK